MYNCQAEWLACWKTRDPTLNAVLLFSKTCKKDAGSKIQFSLISVYKKKWDLWPQSLDLGGSTASNEVNIRPQQQ